MYPWLLSTRDYPVKLVSTPRRMKPAEVVSLSRSYGVIAHVRIHTTVGEFPQRTQQGVRYPIGTFTTTLTGPELLALSEVGEVIECAAASTYRLGSPFTKAVSVLLKARKEARSSGNADIAALSKLVANTLAGRLAQRVGGWSRDSRQDQPGKWGLEHSLSLRTGSMTRYRWVAGHCWRYCEDKLPRGPHTAAFAYLAAYGRLHMWRLRSKLPPRSVVSQDTDGLWLLPAGTKRAAALGPGAPSPPGTLREVGSADSGQWWGPRHYRAGKKWVLAGFGDHLVDPATLMIRHSSHTPLWDTRPSEAPDRVIVTTHYSPIPSTLEEGRVGEDGWILPPHVLASTREEEIQ